jgi:hypothetical protein
LIHSFARRVNCDAIAFNPTTLPHSRIQISILVSFAIVTVVGTMPVRVTPILTHSCAANFAGNGDSVAKIGIETKMCE